MTKNKIPCDRSVTILLHEPMYPLARSLADEKSDGSLGRLIRVLLYAELIKNGKTDFTTVEAILSGSNPK